MIYSGENDGNKVEESVIAKSTGEQKEKDIVSKDNALYRMIGYKKKMTKIEAGYQEQNDEERCHIVEGKINNEYGISNFFSPRGDGMLPGDFVWDFIKKNSKKLEYQ